MIEKSDLIVIIENAFKPLECVAELEQYDSALGFGVHLPNGKLITYKEPNIKLLLDNNHLLISTILSVRSEVEGKGIVLEDWSPPV